MRLRYILLLVAIVVAAYSVLWVTLAKQAEEVVQNRFAALAQLGLAVQSDDIDVGGFPYRIEVRLPELRVARTQGPVTWRFSAPAFDIYTHPWTLDHLVAGMRDLHAAAGTVEVVAPRAAASWREKGGARYLDADLGAITLGLPWAALQAERAQLHLRLPATAPANEGLYAPQRADVALSLRHLALGPLAQGAPAPVVDQAAARFELHGTGLFPLSRESLALWRDSGGTLELSDFTLSWGAAKLTAEGSLTLDEALRPLGALTLRVEQAETLLRYLRERDVLGRAEMRQLAQRVRELQARAGPEQPVMLPLTLQEGVVQLAGIALGDLAPVL